MGFQLVPDEFCSTGVPDAVARYRSTSAVELSLANTFVRPTGSSTITCVSSCATSTVNVTIPGVTAHRSNVGALVGRIVGAVVGNVLELGTNEGIGVVGIELGSGTGCVDGYAVGVIVTVGFEDTVGDEDGD